MVNMMQKVISLLTNLTIYCPAIFAYLLYMKYRAPQPRGYSLIEVLVTLCIISLIITANITLLIRAVVVHHAMQKQVESVFAVRNAN